MAPMSISEPRQTAMSDRIAPASGLGREESWQHLTYGGSPAGSSVSGSFQENGDEIDFDGQEYQPAQPMDEDDIMNEALLHPLREAANRVGREVERFAEVLDLYNPLKATDQEKKKDMAFELIEEYHAISVEAVTRLRNEHRIRSGAGKRKELQHFGSDPDAMDEDESDDLASMRINTKTTPEDLERWEKETRTWDLLHRMTTLQYSPPEPQPTNHIHRYSPEIEVWESFLQNDPVGLERCTVLQWLKDTANESGEDIHELVRELQQNAERGDITAHGWLHTKEAIKKQKRLHAWPYILDHTSPDVQRIHLNQTKTEPLISQLDPDAPGRQDRKLEAPDEYFERSIWLGCYELLRRGKTGNEIKDWCQERQEVWRAVSMSGLPDVLMHSQEGGADFKSKALWRRMCHALTKREGVDTYEAAVYGILSGDYYSIEPVCKNWDDFLFMHYNAQLRSQYENYVLEKFPSRVPKDALQAFEAFDAVSFYGEADTVATRTVAMVNRVRKVEPELRQPLKHIQGVLIAKEFRQFILAQGRALSKEANPTPDVTSVLLKDLSPQPSEKAKSVIPYAKHDDFDGLRVLTHILLAFKSFGMDMGAAEELYAIENIIVAYISLLRLSGKEELIPLYACQLSEDRCYSTLSRVLLGVTDQQQRHTMIKLMQELGLDVQRFVKLQIKSLFEDYPDTEEGYPAKGFRILDESPQPINQTIKIVEPDFMATPEEEADKKMILAFEWYLLVDGMWTETFQTGVTLYKRFFKHRKLAAARYLMSSMSANDICEAKTAVMMGKTYKLDQLLNIQELDILGDLPEDKQKEAKYMARYMAGEAKLYQDLENLIGAVSWLEDVAGGLYELQQAQENGQTTLSQDLRREFANNYSDIRHSADKLLNNWLDESITKGDPELTLLRTTYLPSSILAYEWLLHAAGLYIGRENFLDAMDLATRLAADERLTKLFVETGKMRELVELLASTAGSQLSGMQMKRQGRVGEGKREKGWGHGVWTVEYRG